MNRIGLKVNGIWCVLPDDVSISIEEQNPLFSDSGSFSYPIEMSVSQNRELFGSIDSPQGCIRPQDLDGLPFELWYDGVMMLYGSTETDEDMDIEEDKCSINLVSGNGDFQSKIEGLKCTDVPLMGDVLIGHAYTGMTVFIGDSSRGQDYKYDLDEDFMMDCNVNVSSPYSSANPYCNARICVKRTDDYDVKKDVPYWVYEADRPWSGVCFYVAYFVDCLLSHLDILVKENRMKEVEDMNRLAFFTTKCEHRLGDAEEVTSIDKTKEYMRMYVNPDSDFKYSNIRYDKCPVYATSGNFPDVDVSQVVDSLFSAFGLKIVHDTAKNEAGVYFIRDILRDPEVVDIPMCIRSRSVTYQKVEGVRLTYGGDEEDTAFHYSDWSRVKVRGSYKHVVNEIGPYNKSCYVLRPTGNKYRIKIDSEAEDEGNVKELNPSLFEVSQFSDFVIGKDSEDMEELSIGFTPVVENDVTGAYASKSDQVNTQVLAIFVDAEMKAPLTYDGTYGTYKYLMERVGVYDESRGTYSGPYFQVMYSKVVNFDKANNVKNPILSHDSGFTLGVMRGAGSDSNYEVVIENYDGNGNSAWVTVADDYAFTADTMDAYGNRYDYNGAEEGGVADQENSISLKTHIQTAKDVGLDTDWGIDTTAAKRGLADRFMSEYMYFLLHRKVVPMDVDTTLSQLTSLSWFKQLRIGGTVGRLKSRKYTLSNNGVSGMSIELYTIN